ncbi:MAG: carboxylating nicotinate-nucleotide diphosphorylase [Spirochaetes bacterium]|nr:carboxylating nicotinate-nucleotide diphosphorylase [Spirochaetota bacterium]
MKSFLKEKDIRPIIILALREDIGDGDITTNAIFNGNGDSEAVITAKENGIFCGGDVVRIVYNEIDPTVKVNVLIKDGKEIKKGDKVAKIKGHTKSLLTGERTCLNFIQRMSGIATKTQKVSSMFLKTKISVLDTRKTAPGMRLLDKYSVKCGGGRNHRIGLFDMVLIKDNHIQAAGSITEAVKRVRNKYAKKYKVEVEAKTPDEAAEAARCEADIIMLDNMDKDTMKKSISKINNKAKIEVSGNIDEIRLKEISDLKIDYVSIGALTHSVKAFDLSMKIL